MSTIAGIVFKTFALFALAALFIILELHALIIRQRI